MALKAGRRGLNKRLVDAFGNFNGEVPSGEYYTKTQTDNKFETKTHVNNTFQKKTLDVPIEMLSGSKLTVEDALQGLNEEKFTYADNGVLGAKNLLPNNITSQTINGVTFTVNADGSITLNGTATEQINVSIAGYTWIYDLHEDTIISGSKEGTASTYEVLLWDDTDSVAYHSRDGVDARVPAISVYGHSVSSSVMVRSGAVLNNVTVYPMLRLASDPDDTYVPYAMTNKELTDRFAVLEFTTDATETDNNLSYPIGFNQNNTYAFLFMVKDGSGFWRNGIGTYVTDERVFCVLKTNVITVSILTGDYKGKDMKVLLMKI